MRRKHLAIPVAIAVLIGCVAPIMVLCVFSVFVVEDFDLVTAFSGAAWKELFTGPTYWFLIGKAVLSGSVTAFLTSIVGYPVTLALWRLKPSWKGVGLVMILTPLYTGEIVRIYAWRIVLGGEGLVNSLLMTLGAIDEPLKFLLFSPFTTALVLLYNNLPYMVLAIWISLEMVDGRLIEAARDLGSRPIEAFWRVVFPLTVPGLAAGVFSVFALSAGEMMTPMLLGGTTGSTAMAMIDNLFGTAFDWPMASAFALALLIGLFVSAGALAGTLLRINGGRGLLQQVGS